MLWAKPTLYTIPDEMLEDVHMDNPNLIIGKPWAENFQIAYYPEPLQVDPSQGTSPWALLQWTATASLTADSFTNASEELSDFSDPVLGDPILRGETNQSDFTIFSPSSQTGGHYTYELGASGGVLTPAGGKNLFLSNILANPFPFHHTVFCSMNYRLLGMESQGAPPENVAQIFIGFIFHNNATSPTDGSPEPIRTMFLQMWIANTNDGLYYASENNATRAVIIGDTFPEGLATPQSRSDPMKNFQFDLTEKMEQALEITYPVLDLDEGTTYTFPSTDLSTWALTGIYFGLETQGNSSARIQFSNFNIEYTDSTYYSTELTYVGLFIVGLAALLILIFKVHNRKIMDE